MDVELLVRPSAKEARVIVNGIDAYALAVSGKPLGPIVVLFCAIARCPSIRLISSQPVQQDHIHETFMRPADLVDRNGGH
jgi:hypothetical protein